MQQTHWSKNFCGMYGFSARSNSTPLNILGLLMRLSILFAAFFITINILIQSKLMTKNKSVNGLLLSILSMKNLKFHTIGWNTFYKMVTWIVWTLISDLKKKIFHIWIMNKLKDMNQLNAELILNVKMKDEKDTSHCSPAS